MSKKLFLAVLPFLALAMASCSRGNGGASSSSKTSESSEPASSEESSVESSGEESSGDESSGEDSRAEESPIAEGVSVKLGNYYYELEETTPDSNETSVTQKWKIENIDVKGDQSISFYNNGDVMEVFLDMEDATNINNTMERPATSTKAESFTIHNDADDAGIYLKLNNDLSVSFWVTGYTAGGGGEGGDSSTTAPTDGYAIQINGTNYVVGEHLSDKDYQGRDQYKVVATLAAGDYFKAYNGSTGVAFHMTLEVGGASASFSDDNEKITCTADGTYTLYLKFKMSDDLVYIAA